MSPGSEEGVLFFIGFLVLGRRTARGFSSQAPREGSAFAVSTKGQLYNHQTGRHIPALMWLSIFIPVLLAILVIVCVLLTLVVLMQRPKNEGLGAAFGSGVTENIFGAQTATVLTKATVYLGCIFFASNITADCADRQAERGPPCWCSRERGAQSSCFGYTEPDSFPRRNQVRPQASPGASASSTPAASASPGLSFRQPCTLPRPRLLSSVAGGFAPLLQRFYVSSDLRFPQRSLRLQASRSRIRICLCRQRRLPSPSPQQ